MLYWNCPKGAISMSKRDSQDHKRKTPKHDLKNMNFYIPFVGLFLYFVWRQNHHDHPDQADIGWGRVILMSVVIPLAVTLAFLFLAVAAASAVGGT